MIMKFLRMIPSSNVLQVEYIFFQSVPGGSTIYISSLIIKNQRFVLENDFTRIVFQNIVFYDPYIFGSVRTTSAQQIDKNVKSIQDNEMKAVQ